MNNVSISFFYFLWNCKLSCSDVKIYPNSLIILNLHFCNLHFLQMNLFYFLEFLENEFPSNYALKDDKIGIQIHSGNLEVDQLLIAYEITPEVIIEALQNKIDTILTFHPLIFSPLQTITQDERVGRLTTLLIRNKITVISLHTRFDVYPQGTSYMFAKALELDEIKPLFPINENQKYGMGACGKFGLGVKIQDLLSKIHNITQAPIRFSRSKKELIKKVAIIGGSGTSFLSSVMNESYDAFITADISYHNFHIADNVFNLIDAGHYETESFIVSTLFNLLKSKLNESEISLIKSGTLTNPVYYYPNTDVIRKNQENFILNKLGE